MESLIIIIINLVLLRKVYLLDKGEFGNELGLFLMSILAVLLNFWINSVILKNPFKNVMNLLVITICLISIFKSIRIIFFKKM